MSFSLSFELTGAPETKHFVGRDEELTQIKEVLHKSQGRQTVVLHGRGGMGKTQLAIAYASRHQGSYSAVIWLNAKDQHSIEESLAKAAARIATQYPESELARLKISDGSGEASHNHAAEAVKSWLDEAENSRWLVICDDFKSFVSSGENDEIISIQQYLPETNHGTVLITTRDAGKNLGTQMEIDTFKDADDCLKVLNHVSGRENLKEESGALELVEKLNKMPIALNVAGCYFTNTVTSVRDYLRQYEKTKERLQSACPEVESENLIWYSALSHSYELIDWDYRNAAKFVKLWAFFDNQDVSFELIKYRKQLDEPPPEWLDQLTSDETKWNEAMDVLCKYGLVEQDNSNDYSSTGTQSYNMPACVHEWSMEILDYGQDTRLLMMKTAMECIISALNVAHDSVDGPTAERVAPHITRLQTWIQNNPFGQTTLHWTSSPILGFGDLGGPHAMGRTTLQALELGIQTIERTKLSDKLRQVLIASMKLKLGTVSFDSGDLAQAEKHLWTSLEMNEPLEGSHHIVSLCAALHLAMIFSRRKDFDAAEQVLHRVLRGEEREIIRLAQERPNTFRRSKHESLVSTVYALASLSFDRPPLSTEQLYRGYEMMKAVLIAFENMFESSVLYKNPQVLFARFYEAYYLNTTGQYEEAEKIFLHILPLCEELSETELLIPSIQHWCGLAKTQLGKLDEAEPLLTKALTYREASTGRKDPLFLRALWDYSTLHTARADWDRAEPILVELLSSFGEQQGNESQVVRDIEQRLNIVRNSRRESERAETDSAVDVAR